MRAESFSKLVARGLRRLGSFAVLIGDILEHAGWSAAFRALWIRVLKKGLERVRRRFRKAVGHYSVSQTSCDTSSQAPVLPGVLFIGYAQGALGLGQAFRSDLEAARTAKIPFSVYPIEKNIETRLLGPFMPERYDTENTYSINVIEVAAEQLKTIQKTIGSSGFNRSYNILRTYWELPRAPEIWRNYVGLIDEIWVPNQFVSDAFAPIYDGPIHIIPPAIDHIRYKAADRKKFGLHDGRYYFLFSFDYNSSPFRKNPIGVIKAFRTAFSEGGEPVGLIIKTNGSADLFPQIDARIDAAARQDPRIHVINDHVNREEMLELLCATDAYISLHKAEGFGLGMAEAMMLERSVIGTDFSGSTDFLNAETGFPIPYRLRAVQPHEYPGSTGQFWAQPDLAAAAAAMSYLAKHGEDEKRRRILARNTIREKYNYRVVGERMKARLVSLNRDLSRRG